VDVPFDLVCLYLSPDDLALFPGQEESEGHHVALEPPLNHLNWAWAVFIKDIIFILDMCCWYPLLLMYPAGWVSLESRLVSINHLHTHTAWPPLVVKEDPLETLSLPTHPTPILHLTGGIHRRPCLSPHTLHLFCTLRDLAAFWCWVGAGLECLCAAVGWGWAAVEWAAVGWVWLESTCCSRGYGILAADSVCVPCCSSH
jgi:hypothetical protein